MAFDLQRRVGTRWKPAGPRTPKVNTPRPRAMPALPFPVLRAGGSVVTLQLFERLEPGLYRLVAGVRSSTRKPVTAAEFLVDSQARALPWELFANHHLGGPAVVGRRGGAVAYSHTGPCPVPLIAITRRVRDDWSVEPVDIAVSPATFASGACGVLVPPLDIGWYVLTDATGRLMQPFYVGEKPIGIPDAPTTGELS